MTRDFPEFQANLVDIVCIEQEVAKNIEADLRNFPERNISCLLATTLGNTIKQRKLIQYQVEKEDVLKKNLLKMKKELYTLSDESEKCEQELNKIKEEIKHSKKILKAGIENYSLNFGMDVNVRETNSDDKIIARVTFCKTNEASFNVLIDKITRKIIEFDAASLPEEIREKFEETMRYTTDKTVCLAKLRDILQT